MNPRITYLIPIILGVLLMGFIVYLQKQFPKELESHPAGINSAVMAFEFAQTPEEVKALFSGPKGEERKQAMDRGNHADYIMMLLYGSFLFGFAFLQWLREKSAAFFIAMILGLACPIFDALENVQLLGLTAALPNGEMESMLRALHWFVHLKFGAYALYFVVLIPLYWRFGITGRIHLPLAIAGLITFIIVAAHRSWFNNCLMPVLAAENFLLWISCIIMFVRAKKL